ncbi:TetR family transcriptional regulator [Pseudarthrobacter sp. P1]|uniref:TetR/AcrR family transcriptional regulator n=1 Tax=Pseudarthrobacter sp. P1 TaxID=3418418 RepID=UPI003CF5DC21
MSENPTREAIIEAARHLFGQHGYSAVTIKDVAARAGYSPAMVMKVMGSKAALYAASAPEEPGNDHFHDAGESMGARLVRRVVDRRAAGETEPWAMAPILVHDAPDPAETRAELSGRYLAWVARQIGDTSADQRRSSLVVCAMLGLAAGTRAFGLLGEDAMPAEELIHSYGTLVQSIIDQP